MMCLFSFLGSNFLQVHWHSLVDSPRITFAFHDLYLSVFAFLSSFSLGILVIFAFKGTWVVLMVIIYYLQGIDYRTQILIFRQYLQVYQNCQPSGSLVRNCSVIRFRIKDRRASWHQATLPAWLVVFSISFPSYSFLSKDLVLVSLVVLS